MIGQKPLPVIYICEISTFLFKNENKSNMRLFNFNFFTLVLYKTKVNISPLSA